MVVFEDIVTLNHEPLYRFAFSLALTAGGAGDLGVGDLLPALHQGRPDAGRDQGEVVALYHLQPDLPGPPASLVSLSRDDRRLAQRRENYFLAGTIPRTNLQRLF